MRGYPVVVVGPPRSGTTMTARFMHRQLGILMDASPMSPDKVINPDAWYEDSRLVEANMLASRGMISMKAWTRRFKRFFRAMEKLSSEWGFKDPRITPILSYALSFFDMPTVIRCHRDKPLVVQSMVKKLGWDEPDATRTYDLYERMLDVQLAERPHYRINFDGNRVEEEHLFDFFRSGTILRHAA